MFATIEILSLTACLFLPGLIAVYVVKPKISVFGAIALVVGLSLTLNHILVLSLATLGFYTRPVIIAAVFGQVAILATLISYDIRQRCCGVLGESKGEVNWSFGSNDILIFLIFTFPIFGAAVFQYVSLAFEDFGHAFGGWDPIVSWNRWALVWTAGRIPGDTWEYPQLLPTIWSMIYLLTDAPEIDLFAKALCAWLPVICFFCFADMARRGNQVAAVLSAVSASHFLVLASPFQMLGYADVPAGMLCFVGFYTGLQSITRSGRDADRLVVLGSAVIAGGALTKQSGILFAIGFLMALKILSPSTAPVNARVTKALIVLATLILPWYIYRAIQEVFYDAGSAILFTAVKIHGTKTIWERVSTSAYYLQPYLTIWGAFYFIVPGLLLACLSALGRALLLLCVVPYFVVFAIFFGYDVHNALPIIPFLAWTIGVGFGNASALCQRFISKRIQFDVWTIASGGRAAILLSRVPGVVVLASAAIFALILGFAVRHWTGAGWPNREAMYNGRLQAAMEHGNPEINRAVIALFNAPEARGPIMTSYAILLSFDQVRPFVVVDSLETFNVFTRVRAEGSRYVLDDMTGDPQVSAELEQRRRAGEFRQISSGQNWQLLAVVR